MFSFFSNKLTHFSGNIVDFSKTGIFLKSSHRYTEEEFKVRAAIIAMTAVCAYLGPYLNPQKEDSMFSNGSSVLVGALVGFTLSHAVVIYHIVQKRIAMKKEGQCLAKEIEDQTDALNIPLELTEPVLSRIFDCSLSTEKNANASQTLGRINTVLKKLHEAITIFDNNKQVEQLFNHLNEENTIESIFKQPALLDSMVDEITSIPITLQDARF